MDQQENEWLVVVQQAMVMYFNRHGRILCRRNTMCQRYMERRRFMLRWWQRRRRARRERLLRLAVSIPHRRWWVYPRSRQWWTVFAQVVWEDEQWKEYFRLPRSSFFWLVEILREHLQRQTTNMRECVSVEERVAVALWWFANTTNYRLVGQTFGLARSTVTTIIVEVALAIEVHLLRRVIRPGPYEAAMAGFAEKGFPHCVAAIDGCHIPIRAPMGEGAEYINRKSFFSILLQGTVDHQGTFIHVAVGQSGKNHDAHVLRSTALFEAADQGKWVEGNPTREMGEVTLPPLFLADAAYPMRTLLITPFKGALTQRQTRFNTVHARARKVVERAFGRLKSRWRCLALKLSLAHKNLVSVIVACCILHNIAELGTDMPPADADNTIVDLPVPEARRRRTTDKNQREAGNKIREALADHFERFAID